jgi:SAM-dependent methyltransferase
MATWQEVNAAWDGATGTMLSREFPMGPYYSLQQFERFSSVADAAAFSVEGLRCLDLGCGPNKPFATASLLHLRGAREVVAIDVQPYTKVLAVGARLHALLACVAAGLTPLTSGDAAQRRAVLSRLGDFDLPAIKRGDFAGLPKTIRHVVGDYRTLAPADASFDLCVSFSVFEHVAELDTVLASMKRNMSTRGAIFADIDYKDHRCYGAKLSPWQYLMDDSDFSPGYINRLRHSLMTRTIAAADLFVERSELRRADPPREVLDNLHANHRHWSRDDLSIVEERVLLRHA